MVMVFDLPINIENCILSSKSMLTIYAFEKKVIFAKHMKIQRLKKQLCNSMNRVVGKQV